MRLPAVVALLLPTAVLAVAALLFQRSPVAAGLWLLGLVMGAGLQRTRFCVAAAFRDAVLFFDTGPARAVLLALALSSVTFGGLQFAAWRAGGPVPGGIQPATAGTVVGALLFGVGMLPAGGCVASTLVRLGEGHLRYAWTLLGITLGSLLGAHQYGWYERLLGSTASAHLPALVGWPAALLLQAGLLVLAYRLLIWWEAKGAAQL